jgi:hypothetical protein
MNDTDASGEHTVSFDARTGTRRWTSDFGSAQVVSGALLVQAKPRPPGFNFAGTPQTGTLGMLDPSTGAIRWTLDTDANCDVQVATAIIEMCRNTSQLIEIGLADGRPSITRTVPLGNGVADLQQSHGHRMESPLFVVGVDTVLIAHAALPRPVIDAYALSDLRPLWSGLPTSSAAYFQPCGALMCFISGSASVQAFDPHTGRPSVPVPPPIPDHLELLPFGIGVLSTVVSFDEGQSVFIPDTPAAKAVMLARWSGGTRTLIDVVPGAGPGSCVQVAGYLACTTAGGHLAVWQDRG